MYFFDEKLQLLEISVDAIIGLMNFFWILINGSDFI